MRRSRRARPRPRVLLAPRRTRGTDAFSFPAGGCCLCPGGRVVPLLFGGRRRRGPPVGAHEAGVRWLMAPPTSHLLSSLGDEGRDRGRELCVAAHGRHRPTAHRPPPPLWLHGRLAACRPCLVAGKDGGGGWTPRPGPPRLHGGTGDTVASLGGARRPGGCPPSPFPCRLAAPPHGGRRRPPARRSRQPLPTHLAQPARPHGRLTPPRCGGGAVEVGGGVGEVWGCGRAAGGCRRGGRAGHRRRGAVVVALPAGRRLTASCR